MNDEKDLTELEESKKRQNQYMDKYLSSNPNVTPGMIVKGIIVKIEDGKAYVSVPGTKKEVETTLSEWDEEYGCNDEIEGVLKADPKGKYLLVRRKTRNEGDIKFFEEAGKNYGYKEFIIWVLEENQIGKNCI